FDAFGRIDVLAHDDVAAVFQSIPEVDEVVKTDLPPERLALATRFALSRRIEAQAYDCAFILQEAGTAALVPWLARIPLRIALGSSPRFGLVNRPVPMGGAAGAEKSIADRFAALAFQAGESLPPGIPVPQLAAPPPLDAALANRLEIDPAR